MPLVILLDDIADFTAEQFVDSVKAAGHGDKLLVFSLKFSGKREISIRSLNLKTEH
jgi:hypothetical protein